MRSPASARFELPPWVITSNLVGTGDEAEPGREVTVHYTEWVYDPARPDNKGQRLECSRTEGRPLTFQLGSGRVTRLWEEGVIGMQVGGRRTVILTSNGRGASARGGPGPHAALVYDIELLDVR